MKHPVTALCLVAVFVSQAAAQVGPARARPISGAVKPPPPMLIDLTPRKVVLDIIVGRDGHVVETHLVERSGNGIFDERMRGYWKAQPFVPALDAAGNPQEDTLRVSNTYSVEENGRAGMMMLRNHSDVAGNQPADDMARITRMQCKDFLWEYDFMKGRVPKTDLSHEDLFRVPFAMFLAAHGSGEPTRDALIAQWPALIESIFASCRENRTARYWEGVFVPVFTRGIPENGDIPIFPGH